MPEIAAQESTNPHPNIVVIPTDDMQNTELSALERTSELIGATGNAFPIFFETPPQCSPSRANIRTGFNAHNHGVRQNEYPLGGWEVFTRTVLKNAQLKAPNDVDYHTVFAGTYVNGFPMDGNFPAGWDAYYLHSTCEGLISVSLM